MKIVAFVLVGLALLQAETLAQTSGAWVLWIRTIEMVAPQKTEWEPGEGFSLLPECRQKATDTLNAIAKMTAFKPERSNVKESMMFFGGLPLDNTVTIQIPRDSTKVQMIAISVVCLPATIDPRPK